MDRIELKDALKDSMVLAAHVENMLYSDEENTFEWQLNVITSALSSIALSLTVVAASMSGELQEKVK